jgi:hypothetical protein
LNELYEALIERDEPATRRAIDAIPDDDQLFLAVARFAVLAYAPSLHSKHALLACLAAHDLRETLAGRWRDVLTECAIYAGGSRQPWSDAPILEPPPVTGEEQLDTRDRLASERWLAAHIDDPELRRLYYEAASQDFSDLGHKLIVSNAAWRLAPILGEKGRYAMLRVGVWEWCAYHGETHTTHGRTINVDSLVNHIIQQRGSIEATHAVFLYDAAVGTPAESRALDYLASNVGQAILPVSPVSRTSGRQDCLPYTLARDYAQTLIAHAVVARRPEFAPILPAVHENLEQSEGYEAWTFA